MNPRRWYLAGSALWLLTGLAHGIGQFAGNDRDLGWKLVVAAMRGYAIVPGRFTLYDFLQNLGLWACAMLALLAVLGFVTLRVTESPRALRALAAVNALGAATLTAISAWFGFPPPIVCFALVTLCFALAWFTAPRTTPAA